MSGRLRCFAAFQHAQQLGLHAAGELADFVEENGAAVGHLEQADAVFVGAGEGALAVSEQLALDERLGQAAAVDGDERLISPRTEVVDRTGDQLFTGAGFAKDENSGAGGRNFLD
jgi:hypothetical protein